MTLISKEKVPFSPAGFRQLETQLYGLDDTALKVEANSVLADYIDWVENHVILDTAQISYLKHLDALFIASLAADAAIAFVNRLPLNLVLPNNYKSVSPEARGKWFLDKTTLAVSNSPGKPVVATGQLLYEFDLKEED